jgi:hypothetical protein
VLADPNRGQRVTPDESVHGHGRHPHFVGHFAYREKAMLPVHGVTFGCEIDARATIGKLRTKMKSLRARSEHVARGPEFVT